MNGCAQCGAAIERRPGRGRPRRYCSLGCRLAAQGRRPPAVITCGDCGEAGESRYRGRCEACYLRARYRRLAAAAGGTPPAFMAASRRARARARAERT